MTDQDTTSRECFSTVTEPIAILNNEDIANNTESTRIIKITNAPFNFDHYFVGKLGFRLDDNQANHFHKWFRRWNGFLKVPRSTMSFDVRGDDSRSIIDGDDDPDDLDISMTGSIDRSKLHGYLLDTCMLLGVLYGECPRSRLFHRILYNALIKAPLFIDETVERQLLRRFEQDIERLGISWLPGETPANFIGELRISKLPNDNEKHELQAHDLYNATIKDVRPQKRNSKNKRIGYKDDCIIAISAINYDCCLVTTDGDFGVMGNHALHAILVKKMN